MKGITNSVPKGVRIVHETFTTIITTTTSGNWIDVNEHSDALTRLTAIAKEGRMIKWDVTKNGIHLGDIQSNNLIRLNLYHYGSSSSITIVYLEYNASTSIWRCYLGANYSNISGTYVFDFWYYAE